MNVSSRNHSYLDNWNDCLDQHYVAPILCLSSQALCFLLGTPTLVWCLWISLSGSLSEGLKPTQVFPINLFAVELVFCLECFLEVTSYLLSQTVILKATYVLIYLAWICRPLVQTCICVERYLAVAQPVTFLKYRLSRYRVGTSTLIWVLSFIYACFTITLTSYKIIDYVLIGVYCLGVVVISLCCFFILRVLIQPGPGDVEGGRGGEKQQGTKDPQKIKAFRIILTNLVIIMVSSIPVVVGYFALIYTDFKFYCIGFPFMLIVNILSFIVSPLMHLHREGRLQCIRGPETLD